MRSYSSMLTSKERRDAVMFMDAIGLRHILNSIKTLDINFSREASVDALFDVPNDASFDLADLPQLSRTRVRRHALRCLDHRALGALYWVLKCNDQSDSLGLVDQLLRAAPVECVEYPNADTAWLKPICQRWSRKALMISLSGGHDFASILYLEYVIAYVHALALVHALPDNVIASQYLSYTQRRYTGVMSNKDRVCVRGYNPGLLWRLFETLTYKEQLELLLVYSLESDIGKSLPAETA